MTSAVIKIFDGTTNVKNRYRSLQLVVVNQTMYTLNFFGSYFDSGCSYSDPLSQIHPGQATSWVVANKQGSFFTGVTGGVQFSVDGANKLALFIGFCNPATGSNKHFASVNYDNLTPRYGYDGCENDSMKTFHQNGFNVTVRMEESAVAHRKFVYTILQSR